MTKLLKKTALIMFLLTVFGCGETHFKLVENPQIRTIGTPVKSVNWVRLHQGQNSEGHPSIYATMGQQADNFFLLQIDPETGEFKQFTSKVPSSNYPTATFMSRTGKLYIGSAYSGNLFCFDPEKDTLEDLGKINPGNAIFPCAIDEDADDIIWIGSYGTADLTSYNPRTGKFTRYGRMDDVDLYNYPVVNADGMICCRIMMTRPHLVVFDPRTRKKQKVGPISTKGKDSFGLYRGPQNRIYIKSNLGNYRIEGFKAVPVESIPEKLPSKPSQGIQSFSFADADKQLYRKLEIHTTVGETRLFDLDYTAAGTEIFYLHKGPDSLVYGSSILPLHLFRYNPVDSELIDLGKCSSSAGEAYSMANHEGKIYISSYPASRVSIYDPAQPYHYGNKPEDNPRELGRIDDISYRPRSTIGGPLGRVWLASIPDYGRWGGPLSFYDPKTEEKKAYYRIAGDGSCYTLAHLEKQGLIAVGTSINGGTGTRPKVDQAVLFLWDYETEKKVWEGTLDRPVSAFNALVVCPDGRLFGTVIGGDEPEMFVFDPETRTFASRISTPDGRPLDLGLQNGPDGYIYGFTTSCFYRLDPALLTIEEIISGEGDIFSIPGPIIGNDVYFARAHTLRAMQIFHSWEQLK